MKRRVRGLLQSNWLAPFGALALAWLPILAISVLIGVLLFPQSNGLSGGVQLTFSLEDPRGFLLQLLMLFSNPASLLEPVIAWLPGGLTMLVVCVFIAMPIMVSLSGYFLAFLRGKKPKVMDVFNCFSGRYPRALGGMAYGLLWAFIWFVASFVAPTVLIFAGAPLVSALGIELASQLYAFAAIVIVCIIWIIVCFFVFINRMLAYSLTPICLAAQPRLPAWRAVRLSRKLMRGSKFRLIGLFLSFLNYFIPAIVALVALPLLQWIGPSIGLSEVMLRYINIFLWVVVAANQLVWVYVGPYMAACFHAYYIERKREALMDEEVSPDDFGSKPSASDTQ